MIRRPTFLAALLALAAFPAWAACDAPEGKVAYAVQWGDDRIGTDEVEFHRDGDKLLVRTRMEVKASMLFVTVLRMKHESEEVWVGGRFRSFRGRTVDNGDVFEVAIEPAPDGFKVTRNGESRVVPAGFLPGSPWCTDVLSPLGSRTLVDLIKGKVGTVEVVRRPDEPLTIDGQAVPAQRYEMVGDLQRESWFDAQGRFLRARVPAKLGPKVTIGLE